MVIDQVNAVNVVAFGKMTLNLYHGEQDRMERIKTHKRRVAKGRHALNERRRGALERLKAKALLSEQDKVEISILEKRVKRV